MKQYLEIIFENRNKSYGAYELRVNYPNRMIKALIITMLSTALLIFMSFLSKGSNDIKPTYNVSEVTLTEVKESPIEKPKEVKPILKKVPTQTIKYVVPIIVPNDQVKDPVPEQTDIDNSKIGIQTVKGNVDSGLVEGPTINDGVDKGIINVPPKEEVIFTKVEIEASFPGGLDKWKRYLERTLNAETPIKNGAPEGSYSVIIQFVVDSEGNLSDIQTLTNFGYGLEEEAIRVIKKGPSWNPAIQNGTKVKSYKKQSITFIVSN